MQAMHPWFFFGLKVKQEGRLGGSPLRVRQEKHRCPKIVPDLNLRVYLSKQGLQIYLQGLPVPVPCDF